MAYLARNNWAPIDGRCVRRWREPSFRFEKSGARVFARGVDRTGEVPEGSSTVGGYRISQAFTD